MVESALRAPRRKDLKSESERYKLKPLPPEETAVRDDKASLVTLRVKVWTGRNLDTADDRKALSQ